MDCKTFQELISSAVDLELTEGDMAAFKEHGHLCSRCRHEYEAEAATKSVVRSHAYHVRTPDDVSRRIVERLDSASASSRSDWLTEFFRKPLIKPAVGFALAFVSVLVLLEGPSSDSRFTQASLISNDVILQSLANHRAVLDGHIKPDVPGEPAQLQNLFACITDYSVHMPRMKNCTLLGGVQNEFAGTKLAHLVYQNKNNIVYVYQTCLATVMKGEKLCLSPEAKDSLEHTGWFTESEPDGRTIILWVKGRTLCAAVAQMSKDELMACLVSGDERW